MVNQDIATLFMHLVLFSKYLLQTKQQNKQINKNPAYSYNKQSMK